MTDQRRDVETAIGHHVQHRLKITLLGPTHQAIGVVVALFLIARVVTARAVGAGHLKREFLLVEIRAVKLQAGHAHQHDAATGTAHPGRLAHRVIGGRGRGNDNAIHPLAPAQTQPGRHRILTVSGVTHRRAEPLRQHQLGGVRVNRQHSATVGAQQLNSEQTNQAGAGHHEGLTEVRACQPYTLEADTGHHRKRGGLIADRIRNRGTEVPAYPHHIRVGPVGGHPVPRLEIGHPGADGGHDTHIAIAQRQWLGELGAHRVHRGRQAVGGHFLQHHLHFFRLLPGLIQIRGVTEIHQHAFRAGGDQ